MLTTFVLSFLTPSSEAGIFALAFVWPQPLAPEHSVGVSALLATLPLAVVLIMMGGLRRSGALSAALGWEAEHLDRVLKGHAQKPGGHPAADSAALWSRLDSLDSRLAEISELLTGLRSDIATVIDHVRAE